jgi:LacI family transcriptional regulator
MKATTVYDVAAPAGVSIATVSRVLRHPEEVRPSTRERVLASVSDLGYVPSANARGLAARRTALLGVFYFGGDAEDDGAGMPGVPDASVDVVVDIQDSLEGCASDAYFNEVLRGSEREARRHGFAVMFGVGPAATAVEMVNDMAGRVDGLTTFLGVFRLCSSAALLGAWTMIR